MTGIPELLLGIHRELHDPVCPHCEAHRANWKEVFKDEPCCEEEKKRRKDLEELCTLIP